ncbi:MAG: pyridoxamine 5'-phosphate oxidase family protein, partial [Ginsengibacter sp.]
MPENKDIQSLRRDYRLRSLSEKDVDSNPMLQFESWWNEAIQNNIVEPNAMTLATCDSSGKPSARIVL